MKTGQLIKYIRADGVEINLHSPPSRAVMNMTGWGYPPVEVHTITGPFQHGATVLGYRFQPRTISLDIVKRGLSRSDWFNERSRLIDRLGLQNTNPNLPSLGRLQWEYVENDTIKTRALDCYLSRGLGYGADPQWFEWGILESLEFTASDPIIYDPVQTIITINSFEEELILPVTFPFIVGAATTTSNITYLGSWQEFPVIEVVGPTAGVYIENTATGTYIQLDYMIAAGITVTFDLTPGEKTIVDNLGNNLIVYLTNDSDLAQFVLAPDPIVSGGINPIYITLADTDANTMLRIKYYNRYVGI